MPNIKILSLKFFLTCFGAFLFMPSITDARNVIETVAGGGPENIAAVNAALLPDSITGDSKGNLFVVAGNRVYKILTNGNLKIFAGIGGRGAYCGDGGPAQYACLNGAEDVAIDGAGNLYIADRHNHRVRKVDPAGVITTVAGNGSADFCGDGGLATEACLDEPQHVAVDPAGNLLIGDLGNNRIRKVNSNGTITTVAGNGTFGLCGDGGPATSACLVRVTLAVDQLGRILIGGTTRLRRVDTNGIIMTIAGNETGELCDEPEDPTMVCNLRIDELDVDSKGNIFIADSRNHKIHKLEPTGVLTTVAGNGSKDFCGDDRPAILVCLNVPLDVTVDESGNLFIADFANSRVRKVGTNGRISTIAGNGSPIHCGDGGFATFSCLNKPFGVAIDKNGNTFISEQGNSRIRRVDRNGMITTVAGNGTFLEFCGDGGKAIEACLNRPSGLTIDSDGNLVFADKDNDRIRRVNTEGIISTIAGKGRCIFGGDGGPAIEACLYRPTDVKMDNKGNLFIADLGHSRIRKVGSEWNHYDSGREWSF